MVSKEKIRELAKKYEPYVIETRRAVHRFAETGGNEVKTKKLILKEAKKLKLGVKEVSATGLLVTLDTGRPGNGVALRADMDALPLAESPDNLAGKRCCVSDNPDTCHACGHDAHVAMLLGAMHVLYDLRNELNGRFYFCFEEGEEVGSGWQGMVDALEKEPVNTVFAIHVSSLLPTGAISVEPGARMAGIAGVGLIVNGRGGHGSRPDLSINPVFTAAAILPNLAVAFANQIDAIETVTLGITSIQGGTASNVIADTASVTGTMRFFNRDEGKKALRILRKVANCTADMNNCTIDFHPMTNIILEPTVNDADSAALAQDAFRGMFGAERVVYSEPWFGSESFSEYTLRYKGAMAFLGTRNEQKGTHAEHHNTHFDIDEDALADGVCAYTAYAVGASQSDDVTRWGYSRPPEKEEEPDGEADAQTPGDEPAAAPQASMPKYTLDSKIGQLLKSQQAKQKVGAIVSGIVDHPQIGLAKGLTVRKAAKFLPEKLTPEVLDKIEKALATVKD